MMGQGDNNYEFTLAKQVDNRAFFAKVTLAISPSIHGVDLVISIDPAVDRRWHSAVSFGVEYAWEHLGREIPDMPSIAVRVVSVEWQLSDSTNMTVAFAAANALWEALKHRPVRAPQLDISSASFTFPN